MSRIEGSTWHFGDYVDTDVMYPGAALRLSTAEASTFLFQAVRPGWSELVGPGDIVIGGRSFGAGSGRPVGELLRYVGVAAVLAESMSSLFQRNCINSGLVALAIPGITQLCKEGDCIVLDLDAGVVVSTVADVRLTFQPPPPMIRELIAAGGVLRMLERDSYLPPDHRRQVQR
jgi:3-isopropylmalate/(R)-2-methylmalate dehydratase small subunit